MGLNEKVKGLKISDVYYLLFRGLGGFGHFLNLKNRVFSFLNTILWPKISYLKFKADLIIICMTIHGLHL